jgi:hypothetical protein
MESQFEYSDKHSSGHLPAAHSLSENRNSSLEVAAFPAISRSFSGSLPAAQTKYNTIQKMDGHASIPAQLSDNKWFNLVLDSIFSRNTNEEEVETIDPAQESIDKLIETAEMLGFDTQKLIDHLNQENLLDHDELEEFLDPFFKNQKVKAKQYRVEEFGLIPPKLIENLQGSDPQKLNTLFERFNSMNFTYMGSSITPLDGFLNRIGDCKTLVNMFRLAADAAGIHGVQVISDGRQVLVPKRSIHGRSTKGNVMNKFCWYFDEHHWCSFGGQVYDLLFMTKQMVGGHHYVSTKTYKGVSYMTFRGGWCMIPEAEAKNKINCELQDGEMGIVRTDGDKGIQRFINENGF